MGLAEYRASVLGLSHDYQSLARWFVQPGGGGGDFPGLVRFSFPHLLPDLTRDSISGSSLFLAALRSSSSLHSYSSPSAGGPHPFSSASSSTAPPLLRR